MIKQRQVIRMICIDAVMIALYVVLKYVASGIPLGNIKITLAPLAIIIMAFYFGMKHSCIVAVIGEFIFQLLGYGLTWTTILWSVPPMTRAVIICLLLTAVLMLKKSKNIADVDLAEYLVIIIVSGFIATILNTAVIAIDALIYHYYSSAYVFGDFSMRLVTMLISSIVYSIIAKAVIGSLYKAKLFPTTAR